METSFHQLIKTSLYKFSNLGYRTPPTPPKNHKIRHIMPKNHYDPPQNDSLLETLMNIPRHLRTFFGNPTEEDKEKNLKERIRKELDRHIFK